MRILVDEHLGGAHHEGLLTRIGRHNERKRRNHGFARTHIAQKHMAHALGGRHALRDIGNRTLLVARQREGHMFLKRPAGWAVNDVRARRSVTEFRLRLLHQMHFKCKHFLIHQTTACLGLLGHIDGEMNRAQCFPHAA